MKKKNSKDNLKKIIENLPQDFLDLKQFCLRNQINLVKCAIISISQE